MDLWCGVRPRHLGHRTCTAPHHIHHLDATSTVRSARRRSRC